MIRYRYRSTFVIVMAIVRVALIVVRVPSMANGKSRLSWTGVCTRLDWWRYDICYLDIPIAHKHTCLLLAPKLVTEVAISRRLRNQQRLNGATKANLRQKSQNEPCKRNSTRGANGD